MYIHLDVTSTHQVIPKCGFIGSDGGVDFTDAKSDFIFHRWILLKLMSYELHLGFYSYSHIIIALVASSKKCCVLFLRSLFTNHIQHHSHSYIPFSLHSFSFELWVTLKLNSFLQITSAFCFCLHHIFIYLLLALFICIAFVDLAVVPTLCTSIKPRIKYVLLLLL